MENRGLILAVILILGIAFFAGNFGTATGGAILKQASPGIPKTEPDPPPDYTGLCGSCGHCAGAAP